MVDTKAESEFRYRYASKLPKRVDCHYNSRFGLDERADKPQRIRHQQLVTLGRRGEFTKDEVSKEILHRTQPINAGNRQGKKEET